MAFLKNYMVPSLQQDHEPKALGYLCLAYVALLPFIRIFSLPVVHANIQLGQTHQIRM